MAMKAIVCPDNPPPAGHYVPATAAQGFVFISGQLPVGGNGEPLVEAGFEQQAEVALERFLAVVKAAGGSPHALVKVTAYIVGVRHWPTFDRVYAASMGTAKPARAVIPVPELHHGLLIEIDGTAYIPTA